MPTKVKPAKIISGLEPEKTRYLLQLFTVVATTKDLKLGASEETNDQDSPKVEPRIEETASISMEVDKADAVLNQDRAKLLPAQLDIDFQSLARAVCQISRSTTSMGKYINCVPDFVENIMKERRWIGHLSR